MKSIRFELPSIPVGVPEAMMGIFAVALGNSLIGVLHQDGNAEIVSLADYVDLPVDLSVNSPQQDFANSIVSASKYLSSRSEIASELNTASVPAGVLKLRTAAPLNGADTLTKPTCMIRYTAGVQDRCYDSVTRTLAANSYLAPNSERAYVRVGYGAVGRYSLPCPHPARYLHQYILPAKTTFRVGTVSPQFGQSGGGVEVRLDHDTQVTMIGSRKISDY